jgi:deazaflavin-dependent oxidoreductase (nitroreductase family)
MDDTIKAALAKDQTIDITTTGRKSGQRHRMEIWYSFIDGEVYISGNPGKRDWYANLVAHPDFTFHLKRSIQADLPARATLITDDDERRKIMAHIVNSPTDLDAWVADSPLVHVTFL